MRIISLMVIVFGLAALVCGIIFLPRASAGEQEIADSIAPLTLGEVNAKYDAVVAKYDQIKMAEEPAIQAQTALPSAMYSYLGAQRALLGLAKSNMGTTSFIRFSGIITIVMGLGMMLAGYVIFKLSSKKA